MRLPSCRGLGTDRICEVASLVCGSREDDAHPNTLPCAIELVAGMLALRKKAQEDAEGEPGKTGSCAVCCVYSCAVCAVILRLVCHQVPPQAGSAGVYWFFILGACLAQTRV